MKALRAIDRWAGVSASALRLLWFRSLYPGFKVGKGVRLGRGALIRVLNGASLTIGDEVFIQPYTRIESNGVLSIGARGFIGQGSIIAASERIDIGPDALIAAYCTIRDQEHGRAIPYRAADQITAPVSIGTGVWTGTHATVLKGVTIGDHAIIGAGAVVTKDVPAGAVAVGVPARSIRGKVD